jgi:hypothetical protein
MQFNFKPLFPSTESTSKIVTESSQSPFTFGVKPTTSTLDAKLTFAKPEETSKIQGSSTPLFSFGQTQQPSTTAATTLAKPSQPEPFSLFKATLGSSTSTSQGDLNKFSFAPTSTSTPPPPPTQPATSIFEPSKAFGQINVPATSTFFQTSTKPTQSETTTSSFFPNSTNQESQPKPFNLFGTAATPTKPSTGLFGSSQPQTQLKPIQCDATTINFSPNNPLTFGSTSSQPVVNLFGAASSTQQQQQQPSANLLSGSASTPAFPQFSFGTKPSQQQSTPPSSTSLTTTPPSFSLSNQQTPPSKTIANAFMPTAFNFGATTNSNASFGDGQPSSKLFSNHMNQAQLPTQSFNFNPNANPNFNFSTNNNSNQNGIIQFGGTDPLNTSTSNVTERKFRKAARRNR